jgi:hypothetical protein
LSASDADRQVDVALWEGGVGLLDEARRRLVRRTSLEGASFRSTVGDWAAGQGPPARVAIVGPLRPRGTLAIDAAALLAIHAGHRPAWVLITAWGRRLPAATPPPAAIWATSVAGPTGGPTAEGLATSPAPLDARHWAFGVVRDGDTPLDATEVAAIGALSAAREAGMSGLRCGLVACCDPIGGPLPTANLARWLGRGVAAGLRGPQGVAAAIRSQAARGAASGRLADALGRWLASLPR